jgi:hypothetical protein
MDVPSTIGSRRNRPETAQPFGDSAKNKMAELFGVKPKEEEPPKAKTEEINTLEIGASRRNRRMLSKKED